MQGTNVKQVVNMNIHYIKVKLKKILGIIKHSRTKILKQNIHTNNNDNKKIMNK